jgi:hypothetical protein
VRGRAYTKAPTAADPLNGCADSTRKLYAIVIAEPGVGQTAAGSRVGIGSPDGNVATLIDRGLIEQRQEPVGSSYRNTLWPLELKR